MQAQLPAIADLRTKLEAQGQELSGSWQLLQAAKQELDATKQQLAAAQADQLAAAAAHASASSSLQAQACPSFMLSISAALLLHQSRTEPCFVCLSQEPAGLQPQS